MARLTQFQWDEKDIMDVKRGVVQGDTIRHIAFMIGARPEDVQAKIDELKEAGTWDMIEFEEPR